MADRNPVVIARSLLFIRISRCRMKAACSVSRNPEVTWPRFVSAAEYRCWVVIHQTSRRLRSGKWTSMTADLLSVARCRLQCCLSHRMSLSCVMRGCRCCCCFSCCYWWQWWRWWRPVIFTFPCISDWCFTVPDGSDLQAVLRVITRDNNLICAIYSG